MIRGAHAPRASARARREEEKAIEKIRAKKAVFS